MIIELLEQTSDGVGISGVAVVLVAYFLLSTNKLSSQSLKYQWCNLFGASCVLYSLMFHFNLASVVIEFSWIIISAIGLYRIYVKKNEKPIPDNLYEFKREKSN